MESLENIVDEIKKGFEFSDTDVLCHPYHREWIEIKLGGIHKDYLASYQLTKLTEICAKYNLEFWVSFRGRIFKRMYLVIVDKEKKC